MKTFIIGLFSLALLASGTASANHDLPAPARGQPIANCGHDGIFAIVLTADGRLVPNCANSLYRVFQKATNDSSRALHNR